MKNFVRRPFSPRPGEASGAVRAGVLPCNQIVHAAPKTGLREAFEKKQPCLWQIRRHRGPVRNPKTRFNWRVSDFIRRMMVWWFVLRARITGRGYYCSTLAGQEDYNLTVNSDLTVSCMCQDYDGSGHIGDLRKNTFEEIYFGPVAQRFRDELAKGKIPIPTCVRCTIKRLPRNVAPPKPQLPNRGMLLENTVLCNVDCIGCAREGAAAIRSIKRMPLEDLSRMADLVHQLKMEKLFYLNLGEPFPVANHLPGTAVVARKKSRLLDSGFHQRHSVEHRRQARGGVEPEPNHVFRPWHQR